MLDTFFWLLRALHIWCTDRQTTNMCKLKINESKEERHCHFTHLRSTPLKQGKSPFPQSIKSKLSSFALGQKLMRVYSREYWRRLGVLAIECLYSSHRIMPLSPEFGNQSPQAVESCRVTSRHKVILDTEHPPPHTHTSCVPLSQSCKVLNRGM